MNTTPDAPARRFFVSLCSVPVEGSGTKLDRDRSEGSLGIVPKVAIVSLVRWMQRSGYGRENWDFYDVDMLYPSDDELRAYFREARPDVVGLSAVVSTSYSQVKRMSRIIRQELPDCWIVMGGNLAASSEAVITNTDVDVTVVGDGEIAWVQLLDYIRTYGRDLRVDELRKIPGVCFADASGRLYFDRYGQAVPAKEMVLPDYDILEVGVRSEPSAIMNYFRAGLSSGWFNLDPRAYEPGRPPNIAGVFASKGCVAKCTFCQRATKGYRVQSYEDLDEHLKFLRRKFNVGFVQILDENFGSDRKHSYEFAKILWDNQMLWMATGVRCTSVTEEDIVFYKENGCSALKFGVESGSQDILDLMEKNFSVQDVYQAVNLCIKHGVYSPLAVMVGMPGETVTTASDTGKMIGKIAAMIGVPPKAMGYDIFYALPLPGTPLYEYGELLGVIDSAPKGTGEYLERVTNAGTYKRYYVNLNGAPVSEVIFWDVLVALEASRSYRLHSNLLAVENPDVRDQYVEMYQKKKRSNPRYNLKYTALAFTAVTRFIDEHVIGSAFVDRLPRALIYPLIKWANYAEFLVQRRFKRNMANNLFAMSGAGRPRIQFETLAAKRLRERSLRAIVADLAKGPSYTTIEQRTTFADLASRRLISRGL